MELQDVIVLQMRLNFDLSPDLLLNIVFQNLLYEEHLDGHYVLGLFFSSQVDVTEFSTSQWLGYFESVDVPLIWVEKTRSYNLLRILNS